jgi:hypothetical protein
VAAVSAAYPPIEPTLAVEAYYEVATFLNLHTMNFN